MSAIWANHFIEVVKDNIRDYSSGVQCSMKYAPKISTTVKQINKILSNLTFYCGIGNNL